MDAKPTCGAVMSGMSFISESMDGGAMPSMGCNVSLLVTCRANPSASHQADSLWLHTANMLGRGSHFCFLLQHRVVHVWGGDSLRLGLWTLSLQNKVCQPEQYFMLYRMVYPDTSSNDTFERCVHCIEF